MADTENKYTTSSWGIGKNDASQNPRTSRWQNPFGKSRRFHGGTDDTLHQYGEFISPDMDELEHIEEQQKSNPPVEATPQVEEKAPVEAEPQAQTQLEKESPAEPAPTEDAEIEYEAPVVVEFPPQSESQAEEETSSQTEPQAEVETPVQSEPHAEAETTSQTEPQVEEETSSQIESPAEEENQVQEEAESVSGTNLVEEESESKGLSFAEIGEAPEEGLPLGESFLAKLADLDKKFSIPEEESDAPSGNIIEEKIEAKAEPILKPAPKAEPVEVKEENPPSAPKQEIEEKPAIKEEEKQSDKTIEVKAEEPKETVQKEEESQTSVQEEAKAESETKTEEVSLDDFAPEESAPNLKKELHNIEKEKKAVQERLSNEKKEIAKKRREEAKAQKVRRPIGVTLIAIISMTVLIAMGTVTSIVSYFITQDVRINAEENNRTINNSAASDFEGRINNAVSAARMFIDLLDTSANTEDEAASLKEMFFDRHREIFAIYLPDSNRIFLNSPFLISREVGESLISAYMAQEKRSVEKAKNGSFEILNASPFFNIPTLAFFAPVSSATEKSLALLVSSEDMAKNISSGTINQSCLINNNGIILVHNDVEKMMHGEDLSSNPFMEIIANSSMENSQTTYTDLDGTEYIGAFKKLSNGNGIAITTVKTDIVLEGIRSTTRRNIYITAAILALAILVIWFFSRSLSRPLKELTSIVNEINKGNFNTELFNQMETTKRKDEIGVLGKSTKNEREILNTFAKLTNKGVTKAIITKEIDFEPHLKDITIFFSDIRGFTAISDGFKKRFGERSAGEIILFLNDYMARMVSCIRNTGGVVDKFEGDAIMAAWGVLRNDTLDWENMPETSVTRALKKETHDEYVKEDAICAITSSVAMRYSLMKYNKDAAEFTKAHENDPDAPYKPAIRIGAGLNCGRVTVGFMGSYDKMEFTSIGDAVNLASRTEASNKACGTDVLMTQDMYDLLKTDYIKCEENSFTIKEENKSRELIVEQIPVAFEVKGKGLQHFYGVVNMPGFNIQEFFSKSDPAFELDADCISAVGPEGPKTLSELRTLLGIPVPDFAKVNLGEEENKVKVAGS